MRDPTIPCRWCNGSGVRSLSPPVFRVFKIIVQLGQPTCSEIFEKIKADYQDRTVVNHYVNRLLALKLIKKVGCDRVPRYTAI